MAVAVARMLLVLVLAGAASALERLPDPSGPQGRPAPERAAPPSPLSPPETPFPDNPYRVPTRHGVTFFCPEDVDQALDELAAIRRQGFDLIVFASWVWTNPSPGSPLEQRAQAVLDWCDQNEMAFVLLHNVQFGSANEGGGFDAEVLEPRAALPRVADWARVLAGHPSVLGVLLGNEVGPRLPAGDEAPRLWERFREDLTARYVDIEALNTAWGAAYTGFGEVGPPPPGSRGEVDARAFARRLFVDYYNTLINEGLRPVLGDRLYGAKASLDPFLNRAFTAASVASWDDLLSAYPLWRIQCAVQCVGKPLFNSELHLYHDRYNYVPSVERSRYRYLTSALLGEYLTASFAWGQWEEPPIADIHRGTLRAIGRTRAADGALRQIAATYAGADLGVLVTEANYYASAPEAEHPLARLYAELGTLGRPWRYVLEPAAGFDAGTLVVWSPTLEPSTAERLADRPEGVRLVFVDALPTTDPRGAPLPDELLERLRERALTVPPGGLTVLLTGLEPGWRRHRPGRPTTVDRQVVEVAYPTWSRDRGHHHYRVPYPAVEIRRGPAEAWDLGNWTPVEQRFWHPGRPGGEDVVALVNHTEEPQTLSLPWDPARVTHVAELVSGADTVRFSDRRITLRPLEVRVYRLTYAAGDWGGEPGRPWSG